MLCKSVDVNHVSAQVPRPPALGSSRFLGGGLADIHLTLHMLVIPAPPCSCTWMPGQPVEEQNSLRVHLIMFSGMQGINGGQFNRSAHSAGPKTVRQWPFPFDENCAPHFSVTLWLQIMLVFLAGARRMGHLGPSWAILETSSDYPGPPWDHLGAFLQILGPSWYHLRLSEVFLGPSWDDIGTILGSS